MKKKSIIEIRPSQQLPRTDLKKTLEEKKQSRQHNINSMLNSKLTPQDEMKNSSFIRDYDKKPDYSKKPMAEKGQDLFVHKGYITQNVNPLLLLLLVIGAVLVVGTTTINSMVVEDVNYQFNSKVATLQNISKQLEYKSSLLEQQKEELRLKSERETEFTEQYTSIKGEKETLEQTKSELESNVKSLTSQLTSTKSELAQNKADLANQISLNQQLQISIGNLRSKITELENSLDSCEDDLDWCEDNCPT